MNKTLSTHFVFKDVHFCQLRNVVIDSDDVGQKLLERGGLQQRHTFFPLSKMHPNVIPDQVLRTAQSLVSNKNQVQRAIDLIEYDNRFHPAVAHVFGGTLICSDLNVAKKVAYHQGVQRKCVTLDGDVVNPRYDKPFFCTFSSTF